MTSGAPRSPRARSARRALERLAFVTLVGPALAACTEPAAGLGAARSAIIGGSPTAGDPAVVLLVSYPADHSTFDTCTASVIAPDVLLTAAHCLDPAEHPDETFGVFTGPDATAYMTADDLIPELVAVSAVHIHPDYDPAPPFHADIGVVVLEAALTVAPIPVQREPLTAAIEGQPARIVGYGQTTYQEYNAIKHEATTVIASLEADDTVTVGDLDHRSCLGDSGGPALVVIDGEERIVGVDSYAQLAGCLQPAHYRRPDLYTGFLDSYAPPGGAGGASGSSGSSGSGGAGGSGGSGGSGVAGVGGGDSGGDPPDDGGEGCHVMPGGRSGSCSLGLLGAVIALVLMRRRGSDMTAGSGAP